MRFERGRNELLDRQRVGSGTRADGHPVTGAGPDRHRVGTPNGVAIPNAFAGAHPNPDEDSDCVPVRGADSDAYGASDSDDHTDRHPTAVAHPSRDRVAQRHTHADAHADQNADQDAEPVAIGNPDAGAHAHADRHVDQNAEPVAIGNPDAGAHAHADAHADSAANGNHDPDAGADAHAYPDAHADRTPHADHVANGDASAYSHPDPNAESDANSLLIWNDLSIVADTWLNLYRSRWICGEAKTGHDVEASVPTVDQSDIRGS